MRASCSMRKKNGYIARTDVMRLLKIKASVAYGYLTELVEDGALIRINARYYPEGQAIKPENRQEAVIDFIYKNGPADTEEVTQLLHIGKRTTDRLLKRMVKDGKIAFVRATKQYDLPEPNF